MSADDRPRSSAFLIFANDVDPAQREAYESWHGGHHVPQRLTVPGILSATRYRAAAGRSPEYLTVYDLAEIAVLDRPAYRRLAEQPDAVTQAMRPHLHNPLRLACHALTAADCAHQQVLVMLRMPAAYAAGAAQWLAAGDVPPRVRLGRTAADAGGHPIMGRTSTPDEVVALIFAATPEEAQAAVGVAGRAGVETLPAAGSGLLYERIESFA
jgi:hypothetical protein